MTDTPTIARPTQAEVNYKSHSDSSQCQHCRWFVKEGDGGPYCHVIETIPADVSPTGSCDRHESAPTKEALPPAVEAVEPPAPEFVDETVVIENGVVGRNGVDPLPIVDDEATVILERIADVPAVSAENSLAKVWRGIKAVLAGDSESQYTGFKVAGNHWLITWSNNFEDRDGEIFTAKAIDDYVARVDMGIVPYPELWVWHAGKATSIGAADMVARHEHFAIAAGTFADTKAARNAKAYYSKHAPKTAVSHGFAFNPEKFDGKHYHQFNTFEITLLPRSKEANRFTSLEKVKEMPLTDDKKKYIQDVFGDAADGILEDLDKKGKALEELDVAFKDFVAVDESAANIETEAAKEAVASAEKDFAQFIADLSGDTAHAVSLTAQAMKAMAEYKQATDATMNGLRETVAELKQQLEDRPRSASKDEATALTPERIKQMTESVDAQSTTIDPFWGTQVRKLE